MRILSLMGAVSVLAMVTACNSEQSTEVVQPEILVPESLDIIAFKFDNTEADVLTRRSPIVYKLEDGTGVQTAAGLEIELEENGALLIFNRELSVEAGDEYKAEVTVEALNEGPLTLRIARACSQTDYEEARRKVTLNEGLNNIMLPHVFERDHGCARLTLDTDFETASFILKSAQLTKIVKPIK
jgi:hypothetical protein